MEFNEINGDLVAAVDEVRLAVTGEAWAYAEENRAAIAASWAERIAASPRFFNGVVHVARRCRIADGRFTAELVRTDFASYVHWRTAGYPGGEDRSVLGAAALLSADGQVIVGSQVAGQLNSGRLAFVGGIIDERDCGPDGLIDIDRQIRREIGEETGLGPGEARQEPGYLIVTAGPVVAIVARLRSPLSTSGLLGRIRRGIATDGDGELADVEAIADHDALAAAHDRLVPYARLLAAHLLGPGPSR